MDGTEEVTAGAAGDGADDVDVGTVIPESESAWPGMTGIFPA